MTNTTSPIRTPRKINGVIPPPKRIVVESTGFMTGLEHEIAEGLAQKAAAAGKTLAVFVHDELKEIAEA